jgi:hypothetical protein
MGKRQTIRFVLFSLFTVVFVYYLCREYSIERFQDQEPPAIQALDKVVHQYKKLETQLNKRKITEKNNIIFNVQDDLKEKRRLYILKPTNEQEVTYDSLRVDLIRYISIFNKILVDYNVDLLNMNIDDIMSEKPYIRPTITSDVLQSSDTYTGKI